jgi:hypothetical protein
VPDDSLRSALERNEAFGCWGTYGSKPFCAPVDAAWMPFSAPLADGVAPLAPFVAAGDPWACACVVCAGGFCDENLELMLDIHELRRKVLLWSGGVKLPAFSTLPRLSSAGRLVGIF